ncbi:delta and Notch-like epidermal growth factor-related receptor [Ictalurus furcatus]|uniref:delta and Notch-like epidermal growth factor-related receptor n=1 Tax=Ictalurus furcatus TaxID=66913 RepID=UPI0023509B3E|nr:delta and Notch-like epidermal growth factor-related receptor [Ictalurus furcatus]
MVTWCVMELIALVLPLLIFFAEKGVTTPVTSDPDVTPTIPTDPCEGQPCLHGGVCTVAEGEELKYICACSAQFTGHNCQFFVDPCASDPCLHGNCTREGAAFVCVCSDGYAGVMCDQPYSAFDLVESSWDLAATPATTTQPSQPITEFSDTEAPPTLQPWQPKPGQRVMEVQWEQLQITDGSECVSIAGTEPAGMMTVSMEIAEGTAVKLVLNISGAAALWRVGALGFDRCSVSDGMVVWFQQDSNGLVISDQLLPLGHNYFITVLRIGAPSGLEVTLRLKFTVKSTSCMEPGSSFSDPQCTGRGTCITQSSVSTFYCQCDVGYSGIFCEEFDACYTNPCENNGTCSDITQRHEGHDYTCNCPPGFEGQNCQSRVNHCTSEPCKNGATCTNTLNGPQCTCTEGYKGNVCEVRVDPCASGPCHNNGTCYLQAGGQGFSCTCSPGFTGHTCTQLVDFCSLNPCAHGICRNVGTSYRCLCVPGYHGLYCEEEYNECLSAPCLNFATCRDLINAYECVCTPQYTGRHCEIYKDPCAKLQCQNGGQCERRRSNATCVCAPGYTGENCETDINECESNPCHHGGTCIDQSDGFICHCPPGWVGGACEIHLQWKASRTVDSLPSMPRHSLYIIIGALCVAFVLMLIILIVGICRISRIEYQASSRHAYQEFYNCRSIDSDFSNALASIRHARFGKKSRPAMYDATPINYEDFSPDDKPLVTLIKTKDL